MLISKLAEKKNNYSFYIKHMKSNKILLHDEYNRKKKNAIKNKTYYHM